MMDVMKPIRFTHHACEQCVERGASEAEVKHAVINGHQWFPRDCQK
jgi:hypothetical protein